MRLNQFTDFGLRILMYLAKLPAGQATTITELSVQFGISRNHLVKIIQFLSGQGVVAAQRGRGGGLRLADRPENVRIGQLVELLEQGEPLIDCSTPRCALIGSCVLKGALDTAYRGFIAALDQYTLRDVTGGRTGELLEQLLVRRQLVVES